MGAAAFGTSSQIGTASVHFAAVIAVPYGNAVTPPNLTGNTPIPNIIHPAGISFGEAFGYKLGASIVYAVHSSLYQRLHFYEPLGGNQRLYNTAAALAMTNSMGMVFNFD